MIISKTQTELGQNPDAEDMTGTCQVQQEQNKRDDDDDMNVKH